MTKPTILFVDCFTVRESGFLTSPSSMGIGYGVTASDAIVDGLVARGFKVFRPLRHVRAQGTDRRVRLYWILDAYKHLGLAIEANRPDIILLFHSFSNFPTELRRMLCELSADSLIMGYAHGSHWDPSDSLRQENYPGLELLDLANLASLDMTLFDSRFFRQLIIKNISKFHHDLARRIELRSVAVGIPIDTDLMDSFYRPDRYADPTIVFNHALVRAKSPETFLDLARSLLDRPNCRVLFTRSFSVQSPGYGRFIELRRKFGDDRVICRNDMPHSEYYETLWRSHIQVSTALHESLGISTLEAMYTSNMCFVPRSGSYPEITAHDKDCLYESFDDLLRKVSSALEDPDTVVPAVARLRSLACTYNTASVVGRLERAIERAVLLGRE